MHYKSCVVDGTAGKSEIEKHSNLKKHVKLVNSCKNQQSLTELTTNSTHAKLENTVIILSTINIIYATYAYYSL